jgi:hypothetical protein
LDHAVEDLRADLALFEQLVLAEPVTPVHRPPPGRAHITSPEGSSISRLGHSQPIFDSRTNPAGGNSGDRGNGERSG